MKNISMIGKHFMDGNIKRNLILLGYNQRKLKWARTLDKFLKLLLPPPKPVQPIPSLFNSILVIQSHLIGDLIMTIPLLKALKKNYPTAKIILLANPFAYDLFKEVSFVDEIVIVKFPWATYDYSLSNLWNLFKTIIFLRKRKIDLAIDAKIDMRNALLMFLIGAKRRLGYAITGGSSFLTDVPEFPENILNLLEARLSILNYLGIECTDKSTILPVNENSLITVENFIKENNIDQKKLIGIHPGASKKEKLWPAKNYGKVIKYLIDKEMAVVLIEGPNDKQIIKEIQKQLITPVPTFRGSLQEVLGFISRCRLLICLDSAAIHLGSAVGTSILAIYGPKWPELTKPLVENVRILWNETLECRPCEYGKCKFKTNICMESITPEQVIYVINELIEGLAK